MLSKKGPFHRYGAKLGGVRERKIQDEMETDPEHSLLFLPLIARCENAETESKKSPVPTCDQRMATDAAWRGQFFRSAVDIGYIVSSHQKDSNCTDCSRRGRLIVNADDFGLSS